MLHPKTCHCSKCKPERLMERIRQLEAEIRIAINMCDIIIQFGGGTTAILRLKESLQKALEGK